MLLEPMPAEICPHRLQGFVQCPENELTSQDKKGNEEEKLTKFTDKLIVQTPTIVNQPLIHDESRRRLGELSRKHQ